MKIYVLALGGVFDSGLATVLDAFGTANELAEMSGVTSLRFEVIEIALHRFSEEGRLDKFKHDRSIRGNAVLPSSSCSEHIAGG